MAERFSDIEKPFVIHQPSSLRNRKPRSTACSPLSRTPAGMWRKRPNPRDGLSRNCARRETKFSQLGPPSAAEEGSGMQRQAGGESQGKKSSAGTPDREKSKLGEQIFTQGRGGPQIRTFAESAPAECRGYSEALQRVMTDFGADDAFAGAAAKLKRTLWD